MAIGPRRLRALLLVLAASSLIACSLFLIREAHHQFLVRPESSLDGEWRPTHTLSQEVVFDVSTATYNETIQRQVPIVSSNTTINTAKMLVVPNKGTRTLIRNATVTHPLDRIKVPFPIFVASLPKSGTTSVARYFTCGKIWTAHTFVNTIGKTHAPRKQMRLGHCFLNNIQAGRPPLLDCGNYKVWSDGGHPRGTPCFYPSVHGLDQFSKAYPTATILLVTRNSTAWSKSVMRWKQGQLMKKWRRCEHFPQQKHATQADMEQFYHWHQQNLRDFVVAHPSLTYVEVALEDETIGEQLEAQIGVPAECFGHHNSHEKRMRLNPKFRREFNAAQNRSK